MGLITREEYKDYAGLDLQDTSQDKLIDMLITVASESVESYCRRTFVRATLTEVLDGNNSAILTLSRPPILSVASLKIGTSGGLEADATLIDPTNYVIRDGDIVLISTTDTIQVLFGYRRFTLGRGNVFVTYTGGYENIPESVKVATMLLVSQYYQRRGGDPSIQGQSGGGWSQNVGDGYGPPPIVCGLLDQHRVFLIHGITGVRSEQVPIREIDQ